MKKIILNFFLAFGAFLSSPISHQNRGTQAIGSMADITTELMIGTTIDDDMDSIFRGFKYSPNDEEVFLLSPLSSLYMIRKGGLQRNSDKTDPTYEGLIKLDGGTVDIRVDIHRPIKEIRIPKTFNQLAMLCKKLTTIAGNELPEAISKIESFLGDFHSEYIHPSRIKKIKSFDSKEILANSISNIRNPVNTNSNSSSSEEEKTDFASIIIGSYDFDLFSVDLYSAFKITSDLKKDEKYLLSLRFVEDGIAYLFLKPAQK